MKKITVFFAITIGLIASSLSGYSYGGQNLRINGSGNLVTQTVDMSSFSILKFDGSGSLVIQQGETEFLSIETDDNIMPHILAGVENETLHLRTDNQSTSLKPTKLQYNLVITELTDIKVNGSGDIAMAPMMGAQIEHFTINVNGSGDTSLFTLDTKKLNLGIRGSGNVTIDNLVTEMADVQIHGSGDVELAGIATEQKVSITGSGDYLAADLQNQTAQIKIAGSGSAEVLTAKSLDIEIYGSGDVSYYGDPKVSSNQHGSGDIKSLGEKPEGVVVGERLRPLDFTPFEKDLSGAEVAKMQKLDTIIPSVTIIELQAMMTSGELSAYDLTLYYLMRIKKYDGNLNSVLELNPEALTLAKTLDTERASGKVRGALHGIPIMLKDNIATGDKMHNTTGAVALMNHRSSHDSFVAKQLRDAGAILMAKANLSEWANFMSSESSSGFSALGGQVVNPYGEGLYVFGSSTGSAVATSASFAAATIGTETTGSIIAPAAANGVAGMRPTFGLVSQNLIIPITKHLDSAGPIARSVSDLAQLLTVMAVHDKNDEFAFIAKGLHRTDFTAQLGKISLEGLRIGLPVSADLGKDSESLSAQLKPAIDVLKAQGAEIVFVEMKSGDNINWFFENMFTVLGGMGIDVADYLKAAQAPVHSLGEVITFNNEDPEKYAPYGQDYLEMASNQGLTSKEYDKIGAQYREKGHTLVREIIENNNLDVILSLNNDFSIFYAAAGIPAVTVPIGFNDEGQPQGATFVGVNRGDDARLLGIAHAFEQASNLRVEPVLEK